MAEPEKAVPILLSVPATHWEYVRGRLITNTHEELLLVIEDRARVPGDKFDGHTLWCLPIEAAAADPDGLVDRWEIACKNFHLALNGKEEGTPFPPLEEVAP